MTTSDVVVRPVAAEELDAAGVATAAAYREFFPDDPDWLAYVEEIGNLRGRAGRTSVLVVLVDGEVAGSATLEFDASIESGRPPPTPGEAHLRMLGIAPRFRRRGAGEALLRACISAAHRRGRVRLTLHTTPAMVVAQRIYERFGFRRGTPVVEDGMDLIPFELDLSAEPAEAAPESSSG